MEISVFDVLDCSFTSLIFSTTRVQSSPQIRLPAAGLSRFSMYEQFSNSSAVGLKGILLPSESLKALRFWIFTSIVKESVEVLKSNS